MQTDDGSTPDSHGDFDEIFTECVPLRPPTIFWSRVVGAYFFILNLSTKDISVLAWLDNSSLTEALF